MQVASRWAEKLLHGELSRMSRHLHPAFRTLWPCNLVQYYTKEQSSFAKMVALTKLSTESLFWGLCEWGLFGNKAKDVGMSVGSVTSTSSYLLRIFRLTRITSSNKGSPVRTAEWIL